MERNDLTLDEWEEVVGEQIRAARIAAHLDQARLATLANISVGALSNLERGRGSSLRTVVAVVRALGRTDWLDALAPQVTVSPMQMLRARKKSPRPRSRVRTTGTLRDRAQRDRAQRDRAQGGEDRRAQGRGSRSGGNGGAPRTKADQEQTAGTQADPAR